MSYTCSNLPISNHSDKVQQTTKCMGVSLQTGTKKHKVYHHSTWYTRNTIARYARHTTAHDILVTPQHMIHLSHHSTIRSSQHSTWYACHTTAHDMPVRFLFWYHKKMSTLVQRLNLFVSWPGLKVQNLIENMTPLYYWLRMIITTGDLRRISETFKSIPCGVPRCPLYSLSLMLLH